MYFNASFEMFNSVFTHVTMISVSFTYLLNQYQIFMFAWNTSQNKNTAR